MTFGRRRRPSPRTWFQAPSLLLALSLPACANVPEESLAGGTGTPPPPQIATSPRGTTGTTEHTVPTPDLSRADRGAREQIERLDAALRTALADDQSGAVARAEAYGELGSVYLIYDFLDAAAACFDNARSLEPDDHRWHYLLAYLERLRGALAPAVTSFEQTLALEPAYLPATLRLARTHLDLGALEPAERLFRDALERAPETAAAAEGLGRIAIARGNDIEAIEWLERALVSAPEANGLYYTLAQAHRRLGDDERAEANLARRGDVAVRIADPLVNALGALGESAQLFVVQGAEALDDGDYQAAALAYQRAIELDDQRFAAYRGLSYAVEKLGDLEGAIRHLQTGLERGRLEAVGRAEAERADALRILGGLLVLAGRDAEAVPRFEAALASEPAQADARLKLANALARLRRFEAAVGHYDRLLESRPDAAPALLEKRAIALVNLGRGPEAIADLERAVSIAPDDAQLRLRLASALEHLGEADDAAQARTDAVRLGGGDDDAKARLLAETGRRLLTEGKIEDAVEHFDESLRLRPDQPALRNQLAGALGHLGYLDDALREFRAVIDAVPRHPGARRGEVTVLLLSERYGEARVKLQEALALYPRDVDLAMAQARLLATCPDEGVRDGALALEIASRLERARPEPSTRELLAMAMAANGQFADAVSLQRALISEAETRREPKRLADLRARLARFTDQRAWTAASGEEIVATTLGAAR